jgi:hypothetical protein
MVVTESMRTFVKDFTVHAAQFVGGRWEYQLEDLTGNLYQEGRWYPESSLRSD